MNTKTLDPIERQKLWDRLGKASRGLGLPTMPKIYVGLKVEKGGQVLQDTREEGHSWVRNAWNAFFAAVAAAKGDGSGSFGAGYMTTKETNGTVDSSSSYQVQLYNNYYTGSNYWAAAGNHSHGILVGTSDTAFSVEDFFLGSRIDNGTGEGQFEYQQVDNPYPSYDSGIWTRSLSRVFYNNSGGSITVKEVGLVCYTSFGGWFKGAGTYNLVSREVLDTPVVVANTAMLTVTYEISMDFSSIDT